MTCRRRARWGVCLSERALRALLLVALAALASAGKVHRGKHEAASRRDRRAAFSDTLQSATGGMCNFMEDAPFEELFDTTLNETRWDAASMDGLFHCHRGTAEYCTMARRSNFMMQQVLPFYPSPVNVRRVPRDASLAACSSSRSVRLRRAAARCFC